MNDNSKPIKIIVDDLPAYKRLHVLPLTAAIQSKDPARWPPPERPDFSLLDKILNSTTLTTQCVTHKKILELGEHAHEDLTTDLKKRLLELEEMQQNFASIVATEVQRIKVEMEDRYKQLLNKHVNGQQDDYNDKWEQKVKLMVELENQKIHRLNVEWELRMKDALLEQKKQLEEDHKKAMTAAIKEAENRLNADVDRRASESLQRQLEMLEGGYRDRLDNTVSELEAKHKADIERLRQQLNQQHENEIKDIKEKWEKVCARYQQLVEFSYNVEKDYRLLEEDFRRFINNVKGAGGHFQADYLLRRKQYGLVVVKPEKKEPIKLDSAKNPDFDALRRKSENRTKYLSELAATTTKDPNFWPESCFSDLARSSERKQSASASTLPLRSERLSNSGIFIPVKLVRPLDSDEISDVKLLPVELPEKTGSSFILSLNDV